MTAVVLPRTILPRTRVHLSNGGRTMKATSLLGIPLIVLPSLFGLAACGGGSTRRPRHRSRCCRTTTATTNTTATASGVATRAAFGIAISTSASPYYLATAAGMWGDGSTSLAGGASRFSSEHLVVVDPASPATPVAAEAAGWWQRVAQIEEGVIDSASGTVDGLGGAFPSPEGRSCSPARPAPWKLAASVDRDFVTDDDADVQRLSKYDPGPSISAAVSAVIHDRGPGPCLQHR